VVQARGLAAKTRFRIGRSPEAEINLADRTVSNMHAEIVVDDRGDATITDFDSTNGIRHNGARVRTLHLRENDPVQIGAFKFWVATAVDRRDGSVDPPV
jgi:pSer/pThr/pTyr-binding forkhead associated (FHA) protein